MLAFLQAYSPPAFHASACAPRVLRVSIRLMKSDGAILNTYCWSLANCSVDITQPPNCGCEYCRRRRLTSPNRDGHSFFFSILWTTSCDQGGCTTLTALYSTYGIGLTELACYSLALVVSEMAAHPYSGSFSTSDATNGQ
jgi:hypothetical protein